MSGMPREFVRLPAFNSVEEAIEWCAEHGWSDPTLFRVDSAPVVGSVEVIRPRPGGLRIEVVK